MSPAFTRAFQRASIAAVSGRGVLQPSRQFNFDRHLQHAAASISEGEAALVKAVFTEATALRFLDVYLPSLMNSIPQDDVLGLAGMMLRNPPHRNRIVVEALDALAEVTPFPDVRAEALLRRAVVSDAAGQPDAALRELDAAAQAQPDGWVRYLIAFARGRALERLGQAAAARAAFETALEEHPEGRSARFALAANLYLARIPHNAHLQQSLATETNGVSLQADPWDEYFDGHRRLWRERRAAMREVLR